MVAKRCDGAGDQTAAYATDDYEWKSCFSLANDVRHRCTTNITV